MEIPIPHYPPYTSNYNPIGYRFFPHISLLYQGLIFESVQTVKDLIATATTRTELKLLTTILYNTYQTGRKVAVDFKLNLKIVVDEFLPQWNYTPKPQLQVISSTILRKKVWTLILVKNYLKNLQGLLFGQIAVILLKQSLKLLKNIILLKS
jgi:hypothetical protein